MRQDTDAHMGERYLWLPQDCWFIVFTFLSNADFPYHGKRRDGSQGMALAPTFQEGAHTLQIGSARLRLRVVSC